MQESGFRELARRGDIHVKVGANYRLITTETDGHGELIDLDHNLYIEDHAGRFILFLTGPKGDIALPAGAEGLPPVEESASRQWGREADKALGTATRAAGCALTGCGWYLLICVGLSLLGGLMIWCGVLKY